MKTLVASFLIALSTASFAQTAQPSTEPAQTQVIPRTNSKVDVIVKKAEGTTLSIRIADQTGAVLANQFLNKHNTLTRTQFDLSALPDGVYQVIFSENGDTQKVQDLVLNTHEEATYRTVSMSE